MKKFLRNTLYLFGLPKSLYVCLRLCSFPDALKLPILVSHKTKLGSLSGRVSFSKPKTGGVRIGFGSVETFDFAYQRTILHITGYIHFHGKAKIGKGSKISVEGELTLGENFHISAGGTLLCRKEINIGNNALMAWDSLITDADHHHLLNQHGDIINPASTVKIGNHVWIGARTMILKGSEVGDDCVIGAQSLVTGSFTENRVLIAGNPAKIVKNNIFWKE